MELVKLLEETYGNPRIQETAAIFTPNTQELIRMLREAYNHTKQSKLISRFTRIIKKLDNETCSASEETTSAKE